MDYTYEITHYNVSTSTVSVIFTNVTDVRLSPRYMKIHVPSNADTNAVHAAIQAQAPIGEWEQEIFRLDNDAEGTVISLIGQVVPQTYTAPTLSPPSVPTLEEIKENKKGQVNSLRTSKVNGGVVYGGY